ncbi:MAG: DegT/DnrJ/EryC1/StrS family aminotransferase [Paludibacteraceae bacterium]
MIPRLNISFPKTQRLQFWHGRIESPPEGEYYLNHSRSALTLILQTILPHGGKVGVMAYNCHTVMNAVYQSKCEIEFVDVGIDFRIDLDDLQRKVDKIQVLIVTHLFGIINDVKYIRERYPHLCIIEDCAHAYGIKHIYGDFATFSIGQGKLPSIGDGGILWASEKWRRNITEVYNQLPSYSKRQHRALFMKLCLFDFLYSTIIYAYFTKPILKRTRNVQNVIKEEPLLKMSLGIQRIFSHAKTEITAQIAHQQEHASAIVQLLAVDDNVEHVLIGDNAFMVIAVCSSPTKLKKKMAQLGVESETHFKCWIEWATQFGYRRGSCLQAESLIHKSLMIPTYRKI